MLGGLASAFAARRGWDVTLVRVGLIIAMLVTGIGAVAYVAGWLLVPEEGQEEATASSILKDPTSVIAAVSVIPVLIGVHIITAELSLGWGSNFIWAAVLGTAGMFIVSRNGTETDQAAIRRILHVTSTSVGSHNRVYLVVRVGAAVILVVAGLVLVTSNNDSRGSILILVLCAMGGVVILLGPWWLNVGRDLVLERQARARAEERAEIASRVHDSVLQTLTMIQRSAADPATVARLARKQERELRSWLFDGAVPNSAEHRSATLSEALRALQEEAEEAHELRVELVTVGDHPMSPEIDALVGATREALTNAAKWSGVPEVAVYAEAEPDKIEVFVRDRGKGFERSRVSSDRRGLSESIEGRMSRFGGTGQIRSSAGHGTEVRLTLPVKDGAQR